MNTLVQEELLVVREYVPAEQFVQIVVEVDVIYVPGEQPATAALTDGYGPGGM